MSTGQSSLRLDTENRMCLGVCAGLAEWLDVPTALVRVIFVICALSWPTLILGYFVLYLFLDKDMSPDKIGEYFSSSKTTEHFRELNYRKPLYKNTRDKRIAGVCAGIADYLEVSPFAVRLATVLSLFVFGPFTFWAYVICMFVLDKDPAYAGPGKRSRRSERRRQRHARFRERVKDRKKRFTSRHARRKKSYVNVEVRLQDAAREIGDELENAADEVLSEVETMFDDETYDGHDDAEGVERARGYSKQECTELLREQEMRLRQIEAFMTSKKFLLHCQINRI